MCRSSGARRPSCSSGVWVLLLWPFALSPWWQYCALRSCENYVGSNLLKHRPWRQCKMQTKRPRTELGRALVLGPVLGRELGHVLSSPPPAASGPHRPWRGAGGGRSRRRREGGWRAERRKAFAAEVRGAGRLGVRAAGLRASSMSGRSRALGCEESLGKGPVRGLHTPAVSGKEAEFWAGPRGPLGRAGAAHVHLLRMSTCSRRRRTWEEELSATRL